MKGWRPTRAEALRRLNAFLPRAGRAYARERNFDRGPGAHTAVSTLSPWIRHRLLPEQEVIAAVLEHHTLSAAEKFIQEVFWRTYWKGWLELRPGVWDEYRSRVSGLVGDLDRDPRLHDCWQSATGGSTGIECFDAWARELVATGYLHNHARMWFASIWIFTLKLPWELGADFFLRHLLDGDPASNTLSWRWVAGLQTRGKTYLARRANIARFTEGRFNPAGALADAAPALPSGPIPDAIAPPDPVPPEPDLPTGLLISEEDLAPELLLDDSMSGGNVAVLTATGRRSPLGISPQVQGFVDGAVEDAIEHANLTAEARVCLTATDQDVGEIVEWAVGRGLKQLVTPYTPVGPTAEALATLSDDLARQRIRLVPVLRDYDRRAWPYAKRGFFPFRKQIPALVRAITGCEASAA
ncbi:MAG: FAD-binding domain-containing protein [Gammaproteobacteria bacterium]|jgi:deoxyribodipyrimidine photo-lyase